MKKRRIWLSVGAVVALALVVGIILGGPAYLTQLYGWNGHSYEGHTAGYWIAALDNPDEQERARAAHAVGALGPDAAEGVPALARMLVESSSYQTRNEAALSLMKMVPASKSAVPALTKALEDKEAVVRMNATITLLRLRQDAHEAVPALTRGMKEKRNDTNVELFPYTIQLASALAVSTITAGTADAVPLLTEALEAADSLPKRYYLIQALGNVGPPARPALPLLKPYLEDKNRDVQRMAQESVKQIEG